MTIQIKKVKLKPGNLLSVEYSQSVVKDDETIEVGDCVLEGKYPASDDLVEAFKPLTFHFAILTEQMDETKVSKEDFADVEEKLSKHPVLKNMTCNKVVITDDVLTLCGNRKTRYGKAVNMNGQLNDYNDPESVYEFAYELSTHVDKLIQEVVQYVHGKGASIQLNLFASQKSA